jgi:hypothetical protein
MSSSSNPTTWTTTQGTHASIVINNQDVRDKLTRYGVDSFNTRVINALANGNFKYDYGSGVVVIKVSGLPDYQRSNDSSYRILQHKGGIYIYCHRTNVFPHVLEIVNVFDNDQPGDTQLYGDALKAETISPKPRGFVHGRPCARTFNFAWAAYNAPHGSPPFDRDRQNEILQEAWQLVPAEVFIDIA